MWNQRYNNITFLNIYFCFPSSLVSVRSEYVWFEINYHYINYTNLEYDVDQDHQERIGQVEQEPDLHWLDVRGGGQTGWHWEVDGGQDHHAGDVDGVDHAVLVVCAAHLDVVGCLVDHVDEDSVNDDNVFIIWSSLSTCKQLIDKFFSFNSLVFC